MSALAKKFKKGRFGGLFTNVGQLLTNTRNGYTIKTSISKYFKKTIEALHGFIEEDTLLDQLDMMKGAKRDILCV